MSSLTPDSPVGAVWRRFRCKNGDAIELRRLAPAAGPRLVEMYLGFQPRGSFQGLPPLKDEACVAWVRKMLATGIHIVAVNATKGTRTSGPPPAGLVGHTGLFPENQRKCELLVVVSPDHQNLGIGTELVRGCVDLARQMGFERIWLPVDATNVRARHIYRKCGFEYVSKTSQGRELDMVCRIEPAAGPVRPPLAILPAQVGACAPSFAK
jgi:GNAT superfamily N-acetyltransferase